VFAWPSSADRINHAINYIRCEIRFAGKSWSYVTHGIDKQFDENKLQNKAGQRLDIIPALAGRAG